MIPAMRSAAPAPASAAVVLVVVILGLAAACSRRAEPPPASTAPPAASVPPGAGPPPTTVPGTAGGEERRPALELGAAIPPSVTAIQLPVAGGQPISLGQARRDKGLLVVFTCNSCPYARAWEKRLVALGNENAKRSLGVVFVNSNAVPPADESIEAMTRRVEERGHEFPYAQDSTGAVARAFGAARTPEAFLFDAAGALVYHGTVDDNAQDETQVTAYWLKDALAAVTTGQPVPVTETKALGCAIKLAPPS